MRHATPLAVACLAALAACSQPSAPAAGDAVADAAKATPPPAPAVGDDTRTDTAWRCPAEPGAPPSGRLTAQRIAAADAEDDLPRLYEGPVWRDGALYFSDFVLGEGFPSRVRRYVPPDRVETAIDPSGSNGLALDAAGNLIAATHDRKELARIDPASGARESIVGRYRGEPFNSPNDLAVAADGTIYFTDPDYQRSAAPGGQDATRVYRYARGEVDAVEAGLRNPNGIALSPDGGTLYVVGGTEGDRGVLRAYPLEDGPGPGRDLAEVSVADGMAVDCLGNLYVTEHNLRRVRVFDPQGKELATIETDANVTNAAFGGPDRTTLYITGAGALWSVDLDVAGLPY